MSVKSSGLLLNKVEPGLMWLICWVSWRYALISGEKKSISCTKSIFNSSSSEQRMVTLFSQFNVPKLMGKLFLIVSALSQHLKNWDFFFFYQSINIQVMGNRNLTSFSALGLWNWNKWFCSLLIKIYGCV